MPTISFAIIGHNEAAVLRDCLESVKWADEIIFVDCDSADNSIAIAQNYNAKIFQRKNERAVYINKQFVLDQATKDWVFILDPDERVSEELTTEIKASIKDEKISAYTMPRKNFYFGKWLKYGGKYPDTQLRLSRKGKARFKPLKVHERLEIDGQIKGLKAPLIHLTLQSSKDLIKKLDFFSDIISEKYIDKNYSKFAVFFKPFLKFSSHYFLKLGFLDGTTGLITAMIDFYTLFFSALRYGEKLSSR